ncbi:hypothetical protein PTQ20_15475, partial [Clostridium perfringens]|nr:hypothetical protein [Clostridium perfringens]
ENALLRGKIRGFDTLSDLFRESKKKNRIYAQQNALLVQILSLLIPSTSADESADLPDELETILELDTRPDEESLRLLTSITSKLKNKISEKSE